MELPGWILEHLTVGCIAYSFGLLFINILEVNDRCLSLERFPVTLKLSVL